MLKAEQFFALLVLICLGCDSHEITCPESTRPHKTECNKYFKCIKLSNNSLSWITLTCQEGLIYDKHLRSCAIPDEDWDCNLSSEIRDDDDMHSDESNVYGVKNLSSDDDDDNYYRHENDEFLEVIDGDKDLDIIDEKSRSDDMDISDDDFSGDTSLDEIVTPSSPTNGMLTTQVLRLSQIVQNIPKKSNEITPDDINSYLATQKIQSKSPGYQKFDFHSGDKTTVPEDGKIHPEIETEIVNRQNDLITKMTTMAMDQTTPSSSDKSIFYVNKEPLTEIKLKTGQSIEGTSAHQIVVNRPEGSVLFNVPAASENNNKQTSPYLTEDILKALLEISKQMVTQKNTNSQENHQPAHPIYYAVPIPILSPQSNIPNNYIPYSNQTMEITKSPSDVTQMFPFKSHGHQNKVNNNNSNDKKRINYFDDSNKKLYEYDAAITQKIPVPYTKINSYDNSQHAGNVKAQENYQNYNQQQYPTQYYSPYNNNYPQNYQYYNQQPYYQYSNNDRYNIRNDLNQFSNYNGAYYGNRPFVSDSSAPYVDHSYTLQQNPYRKESFSPSIYENDDDYAVHEESDEKYEDELSDDSSEDETPPKGPTDGLICTFALSRQANQTDCFKYYVCNGKTKEVLTYTCPSFTAFNDQTKFCDSGLYKSCKKSQERTLGSLKNKKIYDEAHKALEQAKRESQKVERIANLVKKQSQRIMSNRNRNEYVEEDDESFYQPPMPVRFSPTQRQKQTFKARPQITRKSSSSLSKSSSTRKKKRKVRCTSIGNIQDPLDSFYYWHCFKGSDGRLKRIHKKCSSNLRFCDQTKFCSPSC